MIKVQPGNKASPAKRTQPEGQQPTENADILRTEELPETEAGEHPPGAAARRWKPKDRELL